MKSSTIALCGKKTEQVPIPKFSFPGRSQSEH